MKQKHLIVRSRNKSCAPLKELIVPITTIYRMGSTTPIEQITKRKKYIEINSINSCRISSNKILMKRRIRHAHCPTAEYFTAYDYNFLDKCQCRLNRWKNGIIAKRKNSSKGNGLYRITNIEDATNFFYEYMNDIHNWIFERYYTYTKEYRIHVTKNGCFYATRKMLIEGKGERWHRHANNSVFILEDNELFDKPNNWDNIVTSCVNALKAIGLDIAAFDIKCQKNDVKEPKYILLESNSAPCLKDFGIDKYKQTLIEIINEKSKF